MVLVMNDIEDVHDFEIKQIEMFDDPVHLMVTFEPKYSITEIVKKLKGISARKWFVNCPETKVELWGNHLWSKSYYAGSLDSISKDIVEKYIENQLTEYNSGRPRRDSSYN